jgi:tectonin beta-propeller repeat-containing protein 1
VCVTDKSSSNSSNSSNLSQNNMIGFRHVSAGPAPGEVWAVTAAGVVCRRHGVTPDNPAGTGWSHGIAVSDMFVQMLFTYLN